MQEEIKLCFKEQTTSKQQKQLHTHLSLSMSTSETKPQATERKENSLLGAAGRLLLEGAGLVVTETRSMGRTPPRQSKKQQFKRRGSRRHMSYLGEIEIHNNNPVSKDKERTVQTVQYSFLPLFRNLVLDKTIITQNTLLFVYGIQLLLFLS